MSAMAGSESIGDGQDQSVERILSQLRDCVADRGLSASGASILEIDWKKFNWNPDNGSTEARSEALNVRSLESRFSLIFLKLVQEITWGRSSQIILIVDLSGWNVPQGESLYQYMHHMHSFKSSQSLTLHSIILYQVPHLLAASDGWSRMMNDWTSLQATGKLVIVENEEQMWHQCFNTTIDPKSIRCLPSRDGLTIIGFGSLQSIVSARVTFPTLKNFRVVRLTGFRRVFRHPAAIFFERGIANLGEKTMASLCAERVSDDVSGGFSAVAFEISPRDVDMHAFYLREEEFSLEMCPFKETNGSSGLGLMCLASSDRVFKEKWGEEVFDKKYRSAGLETIWGWDKNSGILPCSVYLRHCVLAVNKPGFPAELRQSFLDETFLCDRKTTVRDYLASHPEIMECRPPPSLESRYNG